MTVGILRPIPASEELLTSYLARAACQQGVGAYRYCSYHLRNIPVWDRDFDRSASDAALQKIAALFDVEYVQICAMTLRIFEPPGSRFGISPWINAAGCRLDSIRSYGLQYCPQCLSEEPVFRRNWRLSCVVACERHRRFLLDSCVVCGASAVPHRARISTIRCYICGAWLTTSVQSEEEFIPFEMQQKLLMAMTNQCVTLFGRPVTGADLMRCAAGLIGIVRGRVRNGRVISDNAADGLSPVRIELMRIRDRTSILTLLDRAFLRGHSGLDHFCQQFGMTQDHFRLLGALPTWLSGCVMQLPAGARRPRRRSKSPEAELVDIRRQRKPGWREAHAKLLVQSAMVNIHGN